jgi:hypothetical protein
MRQLPKPGTVVSIIAIVFAIVGTATAQTVINDITGDQVRNNSLTGRDVRNNSLTSADVTGLGSQDIKNGRVRTEDIKNGTVRFGDLAKSAQDQLKGQRGPRGANGFGEINYERESVTAPGQSRKAARANCPSGLFPIAGGADDGSQRLVLVESFPRIGGDTTPGWRVTMANFDKANHNFSVWVICADADEVN